VLSEGLTVINRDTTGGVSSSGAVWWLIALWMFVTVGALLWVIPHEEGDLEGRASASVGDQYEVIVEGRDVSIVGDTDSSELRQVIARLVDLRGVRTATIVTPDEGSGSEHDLESEGEAFGIPWGNTAVRDGRDGALVRGGDE